ncbi:flagellin N-methylase [bacterium BMS3Bbin10]|nr:flagellin N-methylase [bacterium BMS3Bbin10]
MTGSDDKKNPFLMDKDKLEPSALDADEYDRQERARREAMADMEVQIIDSVRDTKSSPVEPVRLTGKDSFCFKCHKGVSCWNECCHDTDITLTPFDILRLSRRLDVKPADFLAIYTYPQMWNRAELPVAKLSMIDAEGKKNPCVFMDAEEGCTVYEDRPVACRYYPLGLASVKMMSDTQTNDFYFLVREKHCKGHEESDEQSVAEFRAGQGVEEYDTKNRGWMEILMKTVSWQILGGPYGQEIDPRTKKMFFMATTDVDAFRRFVFETRFLETYDVDPEFVEHIKTNDEMLLKLAFDWLKNVMFADDTFAMKESVLQKAVAKAREDAGAT